MIPINYPTPIGIGGYPNYRSSLISSLSGGGHLGPLSPLGGIGPFSLGLGALPFLSSLRSDHKFLSRSSPIYEPTVASSSIVPQYAVAVSPPVSTVSSLSSLSSPAPAASSNSFLFAGPGTTITNPITALNNLLPAGAFASQLSAAASNQSPAISSLLTSPSSASALSNANSLPLTANSPLTNPTLSNSHLFSSANPSSLLSAAPTIYNHPNSANLMNGTLQAATAAQSPYSNAASNGNNLTDKTMTGSQGELIKQELKEHHLNNIRIQYLKSLRDHLIKDQQMKEQYLKELTKKSSLIYPYLDLYEEVNRK